MKKITVALLSLVLAITTMFALTGCAQDDLIVQTNAFFPPFEYYEGTAIKGVDVDIMTEVAKDLNKKLVINNVDFGVIIDNVKNGVADVGAAGITITEERQEMVDFSIPYYTSVQYVMYKDGITLTAGEVPWAQLEGKKIGVQSNTTGDFFVDFEISDEAGVLYNKGCELVRYDDALAASNALKSDLIDVVVIDKLPAQHITNNNTGLNTAALENAEESYAICVKKGNTELLTAINKVLQEMLDDEVDGKNAIERSILEHMVED